MKTGLKLMLFMESIFLFAGGLIGPLYAILITNIGGTILDIGIAAAVYFITAAIFIYILGRWEDHYKHKEKLYILGYAISALAFLGFVFISTLNQLFFLQFLLGIGIAISVPVRDALYAHYIQKGKEVSQWSYWESMAYLTYGLSAIGGGYTTLVYGFETLFIAIFIILILGMGIFATLYQKYKKELMR